MNVTWPGDYDAIVQACRDLPSPALLIFPKIVEANVTRMLDIAGDPLRLRPHLKTTKMPEVVRLMRRAGITAFKCATLAEMEMAVDAGATDILLACQPVGPNIDALAELASRCPAEVQCRTVIDDQDVCRQLEEACQTRGITVGIFIDLDCGMNRTGISPGPLAEDLRRSIESQSSLRFDGWHVYDGHLRQTNLEERRQAMEEAFRPVWDLVSDDELSLGDDITVIAGGTPTFPLHATSPRVVCSPGTCVLWDAGYATLVPDLNFDLAALLLTRVISRSENRLTLDLGHKAVASENPIDRRVVLPALPDARFTAQSEEHLVVHTSEAHRYQVGDALLGIPWHICPTVALYDRAAVIEDHVHRGFWDIPARRRHGVLD